MNKIIVIAGFLIALSGSVYANENAEEEAKLAVLQECTVSADDAGLEGEDREAFIQGCASEQQQKAVSEEG